LGALLNIAKRKTQCGGWTTERLCALDLGVGRTQLRKRAKGAVEITDPREETRRTRGGADNGTCAAWLIGPRSLQWFKVTGKPCLGEFAVGAWGRAERI